MSQKKLARLHLKISPEELEQLDDWRASNRIFNRSEAIRLLIRYGIENLQIKPTPPDSSRKPKPKPG